MPLEMLWYLLKSSNPGANLEVVFRSEVPPEQIILPCGWELRGPDVGDREIVNIENPNVRFKVYHYCK